MENTKSHSEKDILKGCIALMQELTDEFKDYLEWLGYDLDKLDEAERFNYRMTYFHIVQRLFLYCTSHSGGNSTRAKMDELGVGDEYAVEFKIENEED